MPGATEQIDAMGRYPNPFASIHDPFSSASDKALGAALFREHCEACHGNEARGGHGGPSLHERTFVQGRSDWALFRTVTHGVPGTAMAGWKLGRDEVWRIISYLNEVLSQDSSVADAAPIMKPVTAEELVNAENTPAEWLTYSGGYSGQRFSRLNQINRENVEQLKAVWVRQLASKDNLRLETVPIVRGSVIYVTALPADVYAMDAKSGRVLWRFKHDITVPLALCCEANRGVAVLGKSVFFGTEDGHLIALSADTGKILWDVTVAGAPKGYALTAAPLVVKDIVIVGIAGGDFATRGFIDAYDAATGARRWRFYTVPAPGQPGADTWAGDSANSGGGAAWMTGTFDPKLNLLYWCVGNPNPDYYGDNRAGDNLYTNSVLALDASTGALHWYFQFTPHDTHDWDATQTPILIDSSKVYPDRKLLALANRNGFYYLLDRVTGKFIAGQAYIRQNWPMDWTVMAIRGCALRRFRHGPAFWYTPHTSGATNWWAASTVRSSTRSMCQLLIRAVW